MQPIGPKQVEDFTKPYQFSTNETNSSMMTDNERQRWHSALQQLKRSGEYDRISAEHRAVLTPYRILID